MQALVRMGQLPDPLANALLPVCVHCRRCSSSGRAKQEAPGMVKNYSPFGHNRIPGKLSRMIGSQSSVARVFHDLD